MSITETELSACDAMADCHWREATSAVAYSGSYSLVVVISHTGQAITYGGVTKHNYRNAACALGKRTFKTCAGPLNCLDLANVA